jgi:hypothetical protein
MPLGWQFLDKDSLPSPQREHQPGHLYLAAARAAIERRRLAAFIAGMRGGTMPQLAGKVGRLGRCSPFLCTECVFSPCTP